MTNETLSQRPYLLRAMHEWMTDNGHTPHIIVDASIKGVDVPARYVTDGKIVLNISYAAAHNLDLSNEAVSFDARFSGEACLVFVPVEAVAGIYARETGQGMIFSGDPAAGEPAPDAGRNSGDERPASTDRRSHLKVIK